MIKYAKILDEKTGLCEVTFSADAEFCKSIGMSELDVKKSDIDNSWYLAEKCLMKTDEEKINEKNTKRIAEIKAELIELDNKTIRPLRAGEMEKLEELEKQAEALRAELQNIDTSIVLQPQD